MDRVTPRIGSWLALLLAMSLAGCVSKQKLEAETRKVSQAEEKRTSAEQAAQKCQKEAEGLQQEATTRRKEAQEAGDRATRAAATLETVKQDFAAKLQASREEVEKLAQARLEAEAQAKLLSLLTTKFKPLIDAKQLSLKIVHGRMVLKLRSSVLFPSASADLSNAGKRALKDISKALAEIKGNHFQVAGHTDDNPIKSAKFPSNWELSAARSVAVVKFLQDEGVPPGHLSAAGFAAFQPVYTNKYQAGRQGNRRIEITLLPAIPSQLVKETPKAATPDKPRK